MPNAPKTPTRTIRVPDDLWKAVQKKAAAEKVTVTSIIIAALELYIKEAQQMGKHHDKIAKALAQRQASTPGGGGYKKPGSMNKKKTGYRGIKSNNAK